MGRIVPGWLHRFDRRRTRRAVETGVLQNVSTTWIVIGVVILLGLGIMAAVANSGMKENISIDRR